MNAAKLKSSVAAGLSLCALVVLAAACGGRNRTGGPVSTADKGRAKSTSDAGFDDQGRCEFKGRADREVSETASPGSPYLNVRRVYQLIGTGEDRRKVMVCREVDTNLDGVKDVVRTFNEKGEAAHEEADANYDGKIDTWVTFASGRMAKEAIDTDNDGNPDVWKYYQVVTEEGEAKAGPSRLSRIQRDTNHDGKPDVWEFYVRGRLERMGVDVDHDGHVDRWDHDEVARRAQDAAEKAAERSEGVAKGADAGAAPADAGAEGANGEAADGGADAGAPDPKKGGKAGDKKGKR